MGITAGESTLPQSTRMESLGAARGLVRFGGECGACTFQTQGTQKHTTSVLQESIMLQASWRVNGAVSRKLWLSNDTPPTCPFPHLPGVSTTHSQPEEYTYSRKPHVGALKLFSTTICAARSSLSFWARRETWAHRVEGLFSISLFLSAKPSGADLLTPGNGNICSLRYT
jgi:hypothetical protein